MITSGSPLLSLFQTDWAARYAEYPPMGWALRQDGSRPWVRFHALPESRRYAENDQDRAEILHRAYVLGDRILGAGATCWMVETRTDGKAGAGELVNEWVEDDDPYSPVWRSYVQPVDWRTGAFDRKLLAIADDNPGQAIWMARDTGAAFAPYDGGFDLFPPTTAEVDRLKADYASWLSAHPEGL